MRLTKKGQYALMFTVYLTRSGMVRTQDVAQGLGISQHFIEQIARNLKNAGVISVKRGPGGGYEIKEGTNPTVAEVLRAVGITGLMTAKDTLNNNLRGFEGRVLNHIVGMASVELNSVFDQHIRAFGSSLTAQEVRQLNSITDSAVAS